ncbi:Peptidase family M28 [Clostridium cavendishii DSM 21758]|uniref:Peptidase family M28 n=1 Tax=Clostridium cavendishii DSM 21758 TaxID=1121302 RepID=A0A1M6UFF4_9CLOT|nr:M28 family metallopeptidase [Clostridium cavendishii]SHK67907.1 Peptidase family M28 [Clostridium cavendishii DSM 21758]
MRNFIIKLINFFVCCTLFSFITLLDSTQELKAFDKNKVLDSIKYLASDELNGRLSGNSGNFKAMSYIKEGFNQTKLSQFNNSYLSPFQVNYPVKTNGNPELKVYDKKGNLLKSYEYNKDFKESGLNFKTNSLTFTSKDKINLYPRSFEIIQGDKSFLFYTARFNDFPFRSSFMYDARSDLYTILSPETFNDLIGYYKKDFTITCNFPYKVENTTIYNVVGKIKGINPKLPPLVLTAHFDHVGQDLNNTTYKGALDNASGTAFLLELSSYLRTLPPPERDIIFVALNAEEFGLLGSKDFAEKNKGLLKDATVINFDMIGSDYKIPLSIMSGKKVPKDSKLPKEFESFCKQNSIPTRLLFEDSSDHASFNNEGINAVTLSDGDLSKIHTPDDNFEFIRPSAIDRAFKVAWFKIDSLCYSYLPLEILNMKYVKINGLIFLGFLVIALFIKPKKTE